LSANVHSNTNISLCVLYIAVTSDLCSTQQLPLVFSKESFSKGLGVLALVPLAGKSIVTDLSLFQLSHVLPSASVGLFSSFG